MLCSKVNFEPIEPIFDFGPFLPHPATFAGSVPIFGTEGAMLVSLFIFYCMLLNRDFLWPGFPEIWCIDVWTENRAKGEAVLSKIES